MPVRIYALAKELKLDSKELVELCKKAGISGKGSALASLDDDEAQRVTQFIQGGAEKKKAAPSATAPLEAVRTPVTPQGGPRHVIRSGRAPLSRPSAQPPSSQPTSRPSAPAPAAPTPAQEAAESPAAAPSSTPPAAPAQPAAASSTPPAPMSAPTPPAASRPIAPGIPIRREDRAGAGGKIRVLGRGARSDRKRADEEGAAKGTKPPPKRREPVINLAALPDTKQPAPPRPAAGEPPAQKPEIRLSKDVIAGHKQGMKAPLDKLVQDEKEKKEPAKVGPGGLSGFTGDKAKGRRGATTTRDEDEAEAKKKGLAGMASARADRAKGRRRTNQRNDIERALGRDDGRKRRTLNRKGTNTAAPRKEQVVLELPCSIRQFSEAAGVPAAQVLRVLMGAGVMANINAQIDQATAELIAAELNLDVQLKAHETLEDELISEIDQIEDAPEDLIARPPIVTFLGHVDHGKTSLLDYLIGTSVVTGEAGGITQHIRAYQVDKDGRSITFVDTPGHEAFTEMRARGANVTDIAVLVVAADDGIMPQTEEAISHAKAAGVPIVVALNKIDLEGVDANRVMTQLTEHQLTPSEWGGDVEVVPTSAVTGVGINELLETLLTVAELHEYQANPNRPAVGVCLEAEQQGDRGVIAKMVIRNGTLRTGDVVVCGGAHGRVRAMTNTLTGKPVTVAGPSTPVNVTGLDLPPGAGDRFHVLDDITQAREIAASRSYGTRTESLSGVSTKVSFEHFQELLQDGRLGRQDEKVKLNLIIRADARGSLEAIDKELSKLDNPEVELRVLQRSVGGVTLADATLASASDAVIVAFNVIPDEAARNLADERHVEIRRYDVIYKLTDDIRAMIEGRLRPEERVVELGRALVKQVFQISRVGSIAGCYVAQGSIQRGCRIRVNRDGRTIGDYPLDTLRRVKEDVKEVPRGMECGIKLAGFNDIKQDDVLEAYRIEEFARTLA